MIRLTLILLLLITTPSMHAQVRLPAIVGDSMVLQRDVKLKLWGWASGGERVRITFQGKTYRATADEQGNWLMWLPPLRAGGPYSMEISGSNSITLKNILVGDVWLCSGQSNMVHNLGLHSERYAEEIEKANYSGIRQFLIPVTTSLTGPANDLPAGNWKAATGRDVLKFTVVGYFFAKSIHEKYRVPVGIINASVGGTPIEAWTSEEGLNDFSELQKTIQQNKDTAVVHAKNREASRIGKERARLRDGDRGLKEPVKWYETNYVAKNWKRINIPGYWEDQGIKNLDGVVWYRREIDLPSSMAGKPGKVYLGRIVDADVLYINGVQVGVTWYQYPQRRYTVPEGLLKAGKNVFVVKVTNHHGKGGFIPDKPYLLMVGDQTIDLKGDWLYKVGEVFNHALDPPPGIAIQNQPTALYNAMISPLTNYALKGFLWYQGESNTARPEEYKKLLPALIHDWRAKWKQGDLSFVYAQLPNFMDVSYSPSESQWAELREAQLKALRVSNTAMVVTIDLGEWNDIHPGNKKPIGERMALAAQKLAYGDKSIVYSGPLYKSHRREGNKIVISFDHVGSGLISMDGETLSQFAIAGKDKKFVWANAVIRADVVEVWNDTVAEPAYVRYAWADNPDGANLYNREGLPASPFRTVD